MNRNFNKDEVMAVAAAVLLLFTPLIDALVSFLIGAIIIVFVLVSHFHRHKSNNSTFNPDNSNKK